MQQMKWCEYYERYDGWQDSTQYSRLASITDFGPETSPSSEITDCVSYVDEKTAIRILKLATNSGVHFSGSEVAEIIEYVTQEEGLVRALIRSSDLSTYTGNDILRILECMGDDEPVEQLITAICQKPIHFQDTELVSICEFLCNHELTEKLLLANQGKFSEEALNSLCDLCVDEKIIKKIAKRSGIPYLDPAEEEMKLIYRTQPRRKGPGFLDFIASIVGAAPGASEGFQTKRHSGSCDGDCANCPPHYGYRYGRWYYGHGHVYGCEFGGNCGDRSD